MLYNPIVNRVQNLIEKFFQQMIYDVQKVAEIQQKEISWTRERKKLKTIENFTNINWSDLQQKFIN